MRNEAKFDADLFSYLEKVVAARRQDVITYLKTKHSREKGWSRATINRRLKDLIENGDILVLHSQEELEKYGIIKTDDRASYLIAARTSEMKKHFDEILGYLEHGDDADKKEVLIEIESHKRKYVLSPTQLDLLVKNLNTENLDLLNDLVRILYTHVIEKNKEPLDKNLFVKRLRALLQKYPTPMEHEYKNLRHYIISLLGYYNEEVVVDQFIEDVNRLTNLESVLDDYSNKQVAPLIEKSRKKLFDIRRKLRKDGNIEASLFVGRVRFESMVTLGLITREEAEELIDRW